MPIITKILILALILIITTVVYHHKYHPARSLHVRIVFIIIINLISNVNTKASMKAMTITPIMTITIWVRANGL